MKEANPLDKIPEFITRKFIDWKFRQEISEIKAGLRPISGKKGPKIPIDDF